MNKNEYNLAIHQSSTERLQMCLNFAKHFVSSAAWVTGCWLIFQGLEPILSGLDASQLTALAKVFESLKLGSILGYAWGGVATVAYGIERVGKKRAIRKKSDYQKSLESSDPSRTTSGLSKTGDTPKE